MARVGALAAKKQQSGSSYHVARKSHLWDEIPAEDSNKRSKWFEKVEGAGATLRGWKQMMGTRTRWEWAKFRFPKGGQKVTRIWKNF